MKTETELATQAFIAVATNIGIFPVASLMIRRKLVSSKQSFNIQPLFDATEMAECIIIICTALTSAMYHIGEVYSHHHVSISPTFVLSLRN